MTASQRIAVWVAVIAGAVPLFGVELTTATTFDANEMVQLGVVLATLRSGISVVLKWKPARAFFRACLDEYEKTEKQ